MPVPTPPKQNLLKVATTDVKKVYAKQKKASRGPSVDTKKLSSEIKKITNSLDGFSEGLKKATDTFIKTIPPVVPAKKLPFVPKPHMTQAPFRDNEGLQQLKKELEPKQPVKRNPRRKSAIKKTQEK